LNRSVGNFSHLFLIQSPSVFNSLLHNLARMVTLCIKDFFLLHVPSLLNQIVEIDHSASLK
jgi:hypothetical protein